MSAKKTEKTAKIAHDTKDAVLKRLRRIEGQVRGVHKMVEDGRYCADVLVQIDSVQQALRAASRELLRNHITHCAASALREGGVRAEETVEEIVELAYRLR
jgi:DNA-binding FrmR family transcriptional regulator